MEVEDNDAMHKMKWACLRFIVTSVVSSMAPTTLVVGEMIIGIKVFSTSTFLLISKILTPVFDCEAILFRFISTDSTDIHHWCRNIISYYLHD